MTLIQETQSFKDIVAHFESKGFEVKLYADIKEDAQSSLWFGSDVLDIISKDGKTLTISAVGDVTAEFYETEDDEHPDWFKDKNNAGRFASFAEEFGVTTDEDLRTAIERADSDNATNYFIFDNNNWWEVSGYDGNEFYDLGYGVECDTFMDVFASLLSDAESLLTEF